MTERQFYCVKCKKRVTAKADDIEFVRYNNSKMPDGYIPALRSECPKCDTNMTKFIPFSKEDKMEDKYD